MAVPVIERHDFLYINFSNIIYVFSFFIIKIIINLKGEKKEVKKAREKKRNKISFIKMKYVMVSTWLPETK